MNTVKLRLFRSKERFARISLIAITIILVASVCIVLACNRQEPSEKQDPTRGPKVSKEEAIAIASTCLPSYIVAKAEIDAWLAPKLGPHGTWHVGFDNLNVTREDLGWQEGPDTQIDHTEDVYKHVLVNIDAETGDILVKMTTLGIKLGGPP